MTQDDNVPEVEGSGRGPGRGGGGRTGKGNGGQTGRGNGGRTGRGNGGRTGRGGGGANSGGLDHFSSDRGINLEPTIGEVMAEELLQSTEEAKIKGDEGCV